MHKTKFRFTVLITVLLLSLVLSACGNGGGSPGNKNNGSTPEAGTESTSKPAANEQEVTLKFYFGGDKKAATDEVWGKISEYVKGKGLNVKFDVNYISFGDFKQKMLVMAASGDSWDMNFDGDWLSYKQMAAKGSYMALNDLLPQHAPNLYKKYQDQGTLSAATVDGKIVGLPWTMKMNERKFIGWRSDLAEKAGMDFPEGSVKTIEDVDTLLRKYREAFPNDKLSRTPPTSIYMIRDEWVDLNFHNLGFYLTDPDIKIQSVEQQPFYRESAQRSRLWYDDGLINRDAMIDKEGEEVQWRNGKKYITLTSHEWAYADPGFVDPAFKQTMSELYPDKRFVNRSALANVVAINSHSKHPDLVLRFLDMIETDQTLYDILQYGIEGKTYVLDGKMAVYPDGMDSTTSNYMEWGGQWAFWKPQFMRPTTTYPEGFWESEAEFASKTTNVNSPIDGLFISEENMKNELAKRDTAWEEFSKPIEFGIAKGDVDKVVDNYIALQKKNGIDKIIQETQRQVDEYLASKK
jgi:putative aldouronate transport system substrate-binding protein